MAFHSKQVPISSKNSRAARQAHAKARQEFKTYDTSAIKPKQSKTPYIVLAAIVAIIAVALIITFLPSCTQDEKGSLPPTESAIITVTSGEGALNVATSLEEAGLIGSAKSFVDLVDKRGATSSIISGTYLFQGGTSQEEILTCLLIGPSSTADKLTVPEGFTRSDIASALEEATNGRITQESFMDATADASAYSEQFPFLAEVGNNSLEGFLFPKTYDITAADEADDVAAMMLSQYQSEVADLDWSYAADQGLSEYDVVKLASIVQKEGNGENFGTIASVFWNRLESNRPYLESDATTAYEVGHDPTPEEVHADSAYSTYSNPGLPPTPICNPSLAAIQAVLMPEDTDYMYFYTHDDGTYDFSETYDEHMSSF